MTDRRDVLGALLCVAVPGVAGCDDDDVIAPTAGTDPAALFWDNLWAFRGTFVELADGTTLPYVTDLPLLERIRYGQDGGPPASDVLEGAEVTFEIDGRVLARRAGAEAAEYFGTDYRVLDDVTMRASVRKSIWFPYSYHFDEVSGTLLIQPEEEAGGALMDFVLEIVERTLLSGALDSAAARIVGFLFEDPRVSAAMDAFLYDLVHGAIAGVPVQDPADVTAWLIVLLRESGIVPPETPDRVLEGILTPIVEQLLPLDREGIARALVDAILASDLVTDLDGERVEKVLLFALYRRVLETGQHLASIERVEFVLERL